MHLVHVTFDTMTRLRNRRFSGFEERKWLVHVECYVCDLLNEIFNVYKYVCTCMQGLYFRCYMYAPRYVMQIEMENLNLTYHLYEA